MTSAPKYPGLEQQPADTEQQGRIKQSIRRFLRSQFGRPTGVLGSMAGAIMSRTRSNRDRIEWTLSLLDVQRKDRILEVGFGPGVSIQLASRIATQGLVVGIDHSEAMVRQAAKRNAKAIRDGRVILQVGSASDPPAFDKPFDKIFTINSVHFWNNPVECFARLRKLLKPGGVFAVVLQPRSRAATESSTSAIGEELAANLVRAGFSSCRLEFRKTSSVPVACALATK